MLSTEQVVAYSRNWVDQVIVGCNFCPFAKKELLQNSVRFSASQATDFTSALHDLASEWTHLDENGDTETSLLIFSEGFVEFDDFLQFVEIAEQLLRMQGYEGTYQLAHFHPDYVFADSDSSDPANYTNRSPYPMLHIIREASLEEALAHYPDPESIPQRNVDYARALGIEAMKRLLENCMK